MIKKSVSSCLLEVYAALTNLDPSKEPDYPDTTNSRGLRTRRAHNDGHSNTECYRSNVDEVSRQKAEFGDFLVDATDLVEPVCFAVVSFLGGGFTILLDSSTSEHLGFLAAGIVVVVHQQAIVAISKCLPALHLAHRDVNSGVPHVREGVIVGYGREALT